MSSTIMFIWALIVIPIGVTRGMQILIWDRLFLSPRVWLAKKLNPNDHHMSHPDRSYLSYLMECPYCMSMWVGTFASLGVYFEPTRIVTLLILTALSSSFVAVLLDRAQDKMM